MGLAPSLIVCFLLGAATSAWAQSGGYAAPPSAAAAGTLQPECPADLSARSLAGTLSFSGTGQAFGTPDEAEISISISAQAPTAQDARDEAASVSSQIYTLLEQTDAVNPDDISTTYINANPVGKYNESTGVTQVTAFQYTNALSVTVRNVTGPGLASVLDAVVGSGSDITSIGSVQLKFSDALTNQLTDQARRAAVANVMATAELYSQALNSRLGPLISFEDTSSQSTTTASAEALSRTMAAASTATPVALGQQPVQAVVKASFTICSPQVMD